MLLTFWKPIAGLVALLALGLAIMAVKHSYDDGKREEGAAPVRAEFDAYRKAATERTTAITLAWDQKRIAAETAQKGLDDERANRLADASKRAQALPAAVAAVVVPAAALSVLDDAIRASDQPAATGSAGGIVEARPAPAAAAPDPARNGDGNVGLLVQWGVLVSAMYDACRDQVTGWQRFYADLRAAQPAEPAP